MSKTLLEEAVEAKKKRDLEREGTDAISRALEIEETRERLLSGREAYVWWAATAEHFRGLGFLVRDASPGDRFYSCVFPLPGHDLEAK